MLIKILLWGGGSDGQMTRVCYQVCASLCGLIETHNKFERSRIFDAAVDIICCIP